MSDDADKMLSGGLLVILAIIVAVILGLILFKDRIDGTVSTVPDIVTIEVPDQYPAVNTTPTSTVQMPAPNVNIQPAPDVNVQVPAPNVTVQPTDNTPEFNDPDQEVAQ